MAYTFSINQTPTNGATLFYTLISTLITAGWSKVADSDGTTYSSSGTQITSGGTGAGGLDHAASAWVRMQSPLVNGQRREFTIQRGSSNQNWRIKYSASAGFISTPTGSGTIDATHTGSATDEVIVLGVGTDGTPTYNTWVNVLSTTPERWHFACGGAAEFYSFVCWGIRAGSTTTITGAIALDIMAQGSCSVADVDPAVFYVSGNSAAITDLVGAAFPSSNSINPALGRAWLGATSQAGISQTLVNNVNVGIITYGGNIVGGTGTLGTNPFINNDDLVPCLYGSANTASPRGIKGFSTLFMFGSVARANMTVIDSVTTGSRDKIFFSRLFLPWSGASPLI